MYTQIFNDISQDYYQQNFPNDGQRFVAWYLRNIHLRDPIQARDDKAADIRHITLDLTQRLEDAIRLNPDQYLWAHRRWKVKPL